MERENSEQNHTETNCKCSCCTPSEKNTHNVLTSHWNKTYQKIATEKLGWYEENPEPSLRLIEKCRLDKNAAQLHVGAGTSKLIDELILQGYENIIANDLSSEALQRIKERLGSDKSKVLWIADDLTKPSELIYMKEVDLWHDRAVLHFFNKQHEQDSYFHLVRKLVKKDGFVIIAAFNLNGATMCSGLPVFRYNQEMLQEKLGEDFKILEAFDYTYTMPSGDTREYIYTLFRRLNKL